MNQSSKRTTSSLLAILLLVASLFIYGSLITAAYDDIQVLRGKVAALNQTFIDQKDAVQKIQAILAQFQSLQILEQTLSLTLPNEFTASRIVNDVNGLANANQLKMLSANMDILAFSATAGAPDFAKNVGTVKVGLQLSGSYEAFKTFIAQLETNVRIFDVKAMKLTPPPPDQVGTAQSDFRYDITLNTYYQETPPAQNTQ